MIIQTQHFTLLMSSLVFSIIFIPAFLVLINAEVVTISSSCLMHIGRSQNSTDGTFKLYNCYCNSFLDGIQASSDWRQCTRKCCDPDVPYDKNQRTLDNCKSDRTKHYNHIYQIVTLVLVSIGLVCAIGGAINNYCCKENKKSHALSFKPLQAPALPAIPADPTQPPMYSQQQSSNLSDTQSIQWMNSKQKSKDSCSICMEGSADVELQSCGHRYHGQCWKRQCKSEKQNKCAICKEKDIINLKIYCKKCFKFCFDCKQDAWEKRNRQTQICDTCQPPL